MPQFPKVIGMVHLLPTIGHNGYSSLDDIINHAFKNINNLMLGGADAIMIENNYDLPHTQQISQDSQSQILTVCLKARGIYPGLIGLCCLRNDRKSALDIANEAKLDFIRIPVFVDHIKTHYGFEILIDPQEVIKYRHSIDADQIKIFADIHVKHSTILSQLTLEESAQKATQLGADGVIITGQRTGDLPVLEQITRVKKVVGDKMILAGSGVDHTTINQVLDAGADSCIVGTSLKGSLHEHHDVNIKHQEELIDPEKVKVLIKTCN